MTFIANLSLESVSIKRRTILVIHANTSMISENLIQASLIYTVEFQASQGHIVILSQTNKQQTKLNINLFTVF